MNCRQATCGEHKSVRLAALMLPFLYSSGSVASRTPAQAEGDGVFSTVIAEQHGQIGYVAAHEERLYRYGSIEELCRRAAGVEGGYCWTPSAGRRLYVALPDGRNPDEVSIRVLQAAGHERNGMRAPSRFRDFARGDLRLAPGSLEIDRGNRFPTSMTRSPARRPTSARMNSEHNRN